MRRVSATALALALVFPAVAPAGAAESAATVRPFADASRLVAIGGSLTEIIYALGEEGHLVARDTTGNYPPAATNLPDVGYMRALSPEGVLSVKPTAILAIEGSGPPAALAAIAHSGVEYVEVPEQFTGAGILDKVRDVGAALGVEGKAAQLAGKLDGELKSVDALTATISPKKRVLFVLSVSGGRIMAAGTDTAANGVIDMAGAENAITAYQGYKPLTAEAIIGAKPDVVLLMSNAGDSSVTVAGLLANPAIQLTPAGQNKAVIAMDGEYLLGFGPRTPAAVRELAAKLYPGPLGK